jgi:hypothetical protein
LFFGQVTTAAAQTHQAGASVIVTSGATDRSSGGWGNLSAGATLSGVSASAGFYGTWPVVSAEANSGTASNYARSIAGVDDWLVFAGAAGTYGDVTFHIAGNWRIDYDFSTQAPWEAPWVRFSVTFSQEGLPVTQTHDGWRSLRAGSAQESGQLPGTVTWVDFSGDQGSTASGTYSYDFTTRVYYGFDYRFGIAVTATAPYSSSTGPGHYAFIDDPITIDLPEGVTFTSLSKNTYTGATAAPVPPSLLLLAPGLIGLCLARRRFAK